MIVNFPSAPGLLGTVTQIIQRALVRVVDQDSAAEHVILADTVDKSLWRVTVTNGVLTATRVG